MEIMSIEMDEYQNEALSDTNLEKKILENIKIYFLDSEFINSFTELKKSQGMNGNISKTFKRIENLLTNLKERLINDSPLKFFGDLDSGIQIKKRKESENELRAKKEKIKKEFLERQKNFVMKNQGFLIQNNKDVNNSDEEKNRDCFFCHENFNKDPIYGVFIYVTSDNLIQFCQQKRKVSFKKKNLNEEFSYNDDNNNQLTYSFTSCYHYLHLKCKEKFSHSFKKKSLFRNTLEVICKKCKCLGNVFLDCIEDLIICETFPLKEKDKNDEIKKKESSKNINNYNKTQQICFMKEFIELKGNSKIEISKEKSFLLTEEKLKEKNFKEGNAIKVVEINNINKNNTEEEKEIKSILPNEIKFFEKSTKFFESILRIFIIEGEVNVKLISQETWILSTTMSILVHSVDNITLSGLSNYINHNRIIYRNFYLIFIEYFWGFEFKVNKKFNENIKKEICSCYETLFTKNGLENGNLEKFDYKYNKIAWYIVLFYKNEEIKAYKTLIELFRHVFRLYIVYFCFFLSENIDNNYNIINITNIIHKGEIRLLVINKVIPLARKMVGFFVTVFKFEEKILEKLSPENFLSDDEEIEFYNNLIGENIFTFEESPLLILYLDHLKKLFKNNSKKELINTYSMTFHMTECGKTYEDLQKNFIFETCILCKNFPRKGDPYICLICEKVFCSVRCSKENSIDFNIGNLNRHAKVEHSNKAVFLNLITTLVIFINYPHIISFNQIYQDKFGQKINQKTKRWDNFFLDHKVYNKIQDIVIHKKIPQEICYRILDNKQCIIRSNYL